MMDPVFGLSLTGPIPREYGARREEFFGLLSLHRRVTDEGIEQWELRRGEAVQHLTDLLPVMPTDVHGGHHITSTLPGAGRSEEHTSELKSRGHLVCRLMLEYKTLYVCSTGVV